MYEASIEPPATVRAQGFGSLGQAVRAMLTLLEARLPATVVFVGRADEDSAELLVFDARGEGRIPLPANAPVNLDAEFHLGVAAERAASTGAAPPEGPASRPGARGEVIPLELSDGTPAGALSAAAVGDAQLTPADRDLLDLVARLLVEELDRRRRERKLETLNGNLRQQTQDLAELDRLGRALAMTPDFRRALCETARGVADAPLAAVYEPDAAGALAPTASAGRGATVLSKLDERAIAVKAFQEGQRVTAIGSPKNAATFARLQLVHATEAVLAEPMKAGESTVGVLVVAWKERFSELPPRTAQVVGMLAMEAAVAIEQRRREGELRDLARTDALTGLPNRRAWEEHFARELSVADRRKRPLSIAVLDLDRFKRYNDELGHEAGDRLLSEAAGAWRESLRDSDFMARYGGEEFTLLLPDCVAADARLVVDRIRDATPRGQTCSAGVAQWDGSEAASELLARADRALYQAKTAGRDRTSIAETSS